MIRKCLILLLCFSCALRVMSQTAYPLKNNLRGRYTHDERSTWYVTPEKVLLTEGNVTNSEFLLKPGAVQLTTSSGGCLLDTRNNESAALLLDFGRELQGGIRISATIRDDKNPVKIKVRLGESVTEAMSDISIDSTATNDHAMRDFVMEIPWLGQAEAGQSGFRFAKIELLDKNTVLKINAVEASFRFRDIPYIGSFECNDKRLNQIWNTGAYTVHLNMQDHVWDGIKRDRLVWLGDLHPELMTINTVFGDSQVLRATLDFGRDNTSLPGWMNGMCSYSLWWIISHRDLYLYQGNLEYLREQQQYLTALTKQIIGNIKGNKEELNGMRFLDWPTSEMPEVIHAGLQSLTVMALEAAGQIGGWIGDKSLETQCKTNVMKLRAHTPAHIGNKQAASLLALAGLETATKMSKDVIEVDGAHRFSTFYGYYMLETMAMAGDHAKAMQIISDYWGAMLDLGATTFWEDLDYAHALKASRIDQIVAKGTFDIHSQSGAYCYKGLRHSFCHGWASGPTPWLSKHVLGITPLEPGCSTVEINPSLGALEWAKGTFPTPHGVVSIQHARDVSGNIITEVSAPASVKIISGKNISKMKITKTN